MVSLDITTTTKVLPNFWIYCILIILSILLLALTLKTFLFKNYKFKKNKNNALNIIVLVIILTIFLTISSLSLNINIKQDYIEYRLTPLQFKFSVISKNEIKKIYIDDITNYNKPSLGGDINSYNYILGGKSVLIIQTCTDKHIRLSTSINRDELNNLLIQYQYVKNK